VITGLSWCRPERIVKHVPLRATDCPLMAEPEGRGDLSITHIMQN
jgi:hypothetical protein